MTQVTAKDAAFLFAKLTSRGREPRLQHATGTLRFDLADPKHSEHWLVTITKGDLSVSHKNSRADCTVLADRSLFDGIANGTVNAMTAFLRGAIKIEGDAGLFVMLQRMFPGPEPTVYRTKPVKAARRRT